MALHTLKQSLHTLCKSAECQIDNMFVYAVYAKTQTHILIISKYRWIYSFIAIIIIIVAIK